MSLWGRRALLIVDARGNAAEKSRHAAKVPREYNATFRAEIATHCCG
jgi:hypothetical protein